MPRAAALFYAFVIVTGASFLHAQESRPATVDLTLRTEPAAYDIHIKGSAKGKVALQLPSGPIAIPVDDKFLSHYVDETGLKDDAGASLDRRFYVESQSTASGKVTDDGAAGTEVQFRVNEENRYVVSLVPPRRMLKKPLDRIIASAGATGLWLPLPKDALIGTPFDLPFLALVHSLWELVGVVDGLKGAMVLDAVDVAKKTAQLSGTIELNEQLEENGLTALACWKVDLAVTVDLEARTITRIVAKGTSDVSGTQNWDGKMKGTIAVDIEATSKIVADAATLRATKPVFREKVVDVQGIACKMPSRFIRLTNAGSQQDQFLDSTRAANLLIIIQRMESDGEPGSPEHLTNVLAGLKKAHESFTAKAVSTPVGKGVAFSRPGKGEEVIMRGLMAPVAKGQLVSIKLQGPADDVNACAAEFDKVCASLQLGE
jgi:hypothetical protein